MVFMRAPLLGLIMLVAADQLPENSDSESTADDVAHMSLKLMQRQFGPKLLLQVFGRPDDSTSMKLLQDPVSDWNDRSGPSVISEMAIAAIFCIIFALVYRSCVSWPEALPAGEAERVKLDRWSTGPFDCFSDMSICLWSCCCPAVRWAGTMEMVGLMSFWSAVFLLLALELLGMVPGLGLVYIIFVGVIAYYRNQLRLTFGMNGSNECSTLTGDACFVCCCTCCAISQEARHVTLAAQVNHEQCASNRP
eukprot:CAMPEP_0197648152 /NCGR_PEP_ID=MMETSP1338-20131121/27585_1 /TAXON_ID=43686 ORGANISM="Pelagodinium beii, Strain RCC1491" /NCGR_SAMPLE_ID=MMETSP1338 /ASSEMBLY_ACC=CAM_ASM_000754 /LENGTH=249 /DNA_ID=CAMNT_0043222101 /DNA_START=33 /DNA_END=779 /DNA_ORIENTATION=-